ncbi:coronin-2B [Denticeps clupeoides]|uniref:coronin-2B n=1 Tax=Denticeps clupeoides TaxID=299321 RepID=UPI0010A36F5C|nr:coronin-2B-like [Denticeps clupeoides]
MSWQPPYRSSNFRHMYAKPAPKEHCYSGLPITRSVHDNAFCSVNPRFIAVVTECTGGGAFLIISIHHTGRVDPQHARVCGHEGKVLDVKWDPFSDLRIASCSEDCTVKVWNIPPQGVRNNLTTPLKELRGHTRRVGLIEWHPTARDILFSSAYDCKVLVWRLDVCECVCCRPVRVIDSHTEVLLSLSFNTDGSRLATACRDKSVRVIHTHTGELLQQGSVNSHRPTKVVFVGDLNLLISTGVSCWNQRQITVWNPADLSEPLLEEDLDGDAGVLFPFYDPDTHLLYLAGKGDGNIRCFELSAEEPYLHFTAEYRSPLPQKSMAVMPKRGLDLSDCEVFRFYRLVGIKNLVEPVSLIVPRKSDGFQDDLFPPTAANEAAMSAAEWIQGHTRGPVLMSLKPGAEVENPYPAPEPRLSKHQNPSPPPSAANQAEEQRPGDPSDLSDWQEDDTHASSPCPHVTRSPLQWCESPVYTPPSPDDQLLVVFYRQCEELRILKAELQEKDERISRLQQQITQQCDIPAPH